MSCGIQQTWGVGRDGCMDSCSSHQLLDSPVFASFSRVKNSVICCCPKAQIGNHPQVGVKKCLKPSASLGVQKFITWICFVIKCLPFLVKLWSQWQPPFPTFSNSACPIGPDDVTDALEAVGALVTGTDGPATGGAGAAEAPLRLRRGARASKAKAKRDGKVARMATKPGGGWWLFGENLSKTYGRWGAGGVWGFLFFVVCKHHTLK